MKVAIYNDCFISKRPHFGCELVMKTFEEQLERVDIELLGTVKLTECGNFNSEILKKADLVIVNGEGSFHHNRRNDLAEISKHFPSILINTVFYKNDVDTSNFLFKSARETESAKNLGCEVIPDIIFTSEILNNHCKKIHDTTKRIYYGDIRHTSGIKTLQSLDSFLKTIMGYDIVTSESFHGIIVAKLLDIECIEVLDGAGVYYKTHCLYKDMNTIPDYVEMAKTKINSLFEKLHTF